MADRTVNLFLEDNNNINNKNTRDLIVGIVWFIVGIIICAKTDLNYILTFIISLIVPVYCIKLIWDRNAIFQWERFKKYKSYLKDLYGDYSTKFGREDIEGSIFVFEKVEILIIKGNRFEFNEILDFSISDKATYKTSTSTESMLGRGLIGGLMFGGVGALAGANTASTTTTKVSSTYKFNIILNDFSEPNFVTEVTNEEDANKLTSILKLIIDKNDSNFDKK